MDELVALLHCTEQVNEDEDRMDPELVSAVTGVVLSLESNMSLLLSNHMAKDKLVRNLTSRVFIKHCSSIAKHSVKSVFNEDSWIETSSYNNVPFFAT